jgi:hypothetical protein
MACVVGVAMLRPISSTAFIVCQSPAGQARRETSQDHTGSPRPLTMVWSSDQV